MKVTASEDPPAPPGEDDAAVIERSRTDPECFAKLFDKYAPRLHRYAARRQGDAVADDIVAETFLVAFKQRDGYDLTRSNASPWLYGIATNLMRRNLRTEIGRYRAFARTGMVPEDVTCPLSSPIRDTSYAAMVTWPTEPMALRAFLLTAAPASWWGGSVSVERRLWETASILLTSRPVPPKLRAGLFRVLAGVPGVRVVPGAASRHDVAVTRSYATGDEPVEQEQDALVFDRTTHRFLGSRAVTAARTGRYPAGTPLGSQTLGKITVVDHLPRGVELQTQCH